MKIIYTDVLVIGGGAIGMLAALLLEPAPAPQP